MTVEEHAAAAFATDTQEHKMTVLADHPGGYRHVRFATPETYAYRYDLVTWPGHLAITGDMGGYVFARTNDMFRFFDRPVPTINPDYWAEKLIARGSDVKVLSMERIREWVTDWRRDAEYPIPSPGLDEAIASLLRDAEECLPDGSAVRSLLMEFTWEGHGMGDAWEWDITEYTFHYLWCCWAIASGVRRYWQSRHE